MIQRQRFRWPGALRFTSVPFTVNKTGSVITTTTPAGPPGIGDITVTDLAGSATTPFART